MKNILILESPRPSINAVLRDIGQALRHHNFLVIYERGHLHPASFPDNQSLFNALSARFYAANPDFVIMAGIEGIIYFPEIMPGHHLLEILQIPFISVNFESPVRSLYRAVQIAESPLCSIAVHERAFVDNLASFGFENIAYLPGAARPERFEIGQNDLCEGLDPEAPLAFAGVLTNRERLTWSRFVSAVHLIPAIIREVDEVGRPLNRVILDHVEHMVDVHDLTRADFSPRINAQLFSFCASEINFRKRREILADLAPRRINAAGRGWETEEADHIQGLKGLDYYTELPALFSHAAITLGISSSENLTAAPLNVFDCFASGGFMLSDFREDLGNYFREGEEIDFYRTRAELTEKIDYYLANPEHRLEIAGRAREKIALEHTWERRVIKIIETIEKLEGKGAGQRTVIAAGPPPLGASISAVIIACNESAELPRCLESLRGAVDDIVVMDNGSIDQTPQIARQYGCRVFFAPWEHDFSRARNRALALATGDWVLIIDADEELLPAGGTRLRETIQQALPQADAFSLPIGEGRRAVRLLRRVSGVIFEDALDDYVLVRPEHTVEAAEIGLLNRRRPETPEGEQRIKEALAQGRATLHGLYSLTCALFRRGDWAGAREYGERFLIRVEKHPLGKSLYAHVNTWVAEVCLQEGDQERALELAFDVLNRSPEDLSLWYLAARAWQAQGDITRAYLAAQRFFALPGCRTHAGATDVAAIRKRSRRQLKLPGRGKTPSCGSIGVGLRYDIDFTTLAAQIENIGVFADEIIVANASPLPTEAIPAIDDPRVRIIDLGSDRDLSAGWNALKEAAQSDWILMLNPGEKVDAASAVLFRDIMGLACQDGVDAFDMICDAYEAQRINRRQCETRLIRRDSELVFEGEVYGRIGGKGVRPCAGITINVHSDDEYNQQSLARMDAKLKILQNEEMEESPEHFADITMAATETGNWPTVVVNAQKGLVSFTAQDPDDEPVRFKRLHVLLIKGLIEMELLEEAEQFCRALIKAFPDYIEGYYQLIIVFSLRNEYGRPLEEAVQHYTETREKTLEPPYSEKAPVYGLFRQGAVTLLRGAVEILKNEEGLPFLRQGLDQMRGVLPEFLRDFLQTNTETILTSKGVAALLTEYEDSVDCLLLLIHLNSIMGDNDARLRNLARLGAASVYHRGDAAYYQAEIHLENGDKQEAVGSYVRAVNEYQDLVSSGARIPVEMLVRYAESLERLGRITTAISVYEFLLRICNKADVEVIRGKIRQLQQYID